MQQPAFTNDLAGQRGREVKPPLEGAASPHEHVDRYAGPPEDLVGEAASLPVGRMRVWNHDHQVEVAVFAIVAARSRPEQVDPVGLEGLGKPSSDLGETLLAIPEAFPVSFHPSSLDEIIPSPITGQEPATDMNPRLTALPGRGQGARDPGKARTIPIHPTMGNQYPSRGNAGTYSAPGWRRGT